MTLPLEKIALGIGALLCVVALILGFAGGRSAAEIVGQQAVSVNPYEEALLPEAQLRTVAFRSFPTQRGEVGWEFALFTPPNVWYSPETNELIPFPPRIIIEEPEVEEVEEVDEGPRPIPFGLVFIGVEEMPFPISLDGYIGEEGEFYVTLRNLETNQTFLSAPGRNHPEHGIRVVDFRVLRRDVEGVRFTEGEVTLIHLETGNEIVLLQGERVGSGDFRALFNSTARPEERVRLVPGANYTEGEVVFTLEAMDRSVPEVVVVRNELGRSQPVRFTLQLDEQIEIMPVVDAPEASAENDE